MQEATQSRQERRRKRRSMVRHVPATVLGRRVMETQLLDPEIEGRVENSWTSLTPQECDVLRAKQRGEEYLSIEEAERLRKARPSKDRARKMDLGDALVRIVQAATGGKPLDAVGAARLEESEDLRRIAKEIEDEDALDRVTSEDE